jgi:4-amino-4-deoxy-L-arabinose transferase-like glycosyltransferase
VLLHSRLPYWSALTRARAAMLVFPIVAVVYVCLLGRYFGNRMIGCAAAVLFSTDPTLLGHASWVTTDVAACAGYLAATYHGIRLLARPTWARALAAGVALGLAISCKFSCALVVVSLALIWITRRRRPRRIALLTAVPFAAAFLTLWATYLFDIGVVPGRLNNLPVPMPSALMV